jgi:hypothetical protein
MNEDEVPAGSVAQSLRDSNLSRTTCVSTWKPSFGLPVCTVSPARRCSMRSTSSFCSLKSHSAEGRPIWWNTPTKWFSSSNEILAMSFFIGVFL